MTDGQHFGGPPTGCVAQCLPPPPPCSTVAGFPAAQLLVKDEVVGAGRAPVLGIVGAHHAFTDQKDSEGQSVSSTVLTQNPSREGSRSQNGL